ncbi:MAG: hypothetical protein HY606_02910 [Planctomycetes bacterium]|nr:hypothetical protein [Planctomycetota bacterium]
MAKVWKTLYSLPILCVSGVLFFFVLTSKNAEAIPAWARKYKTSCATCHESFPKLNATGEAFRLNGYKFNDDDQVVKEEKVILGQDAYKKMWPDSIWPADISSVPPISIRLLPDFNIPIGGKRGRESATDFNFPHEAAILAAGTIGADMSYFFELEFEVEDGETLTEFEAAWWQWEDLVGPENVFNLRLGTIGMQEFGPFTARDHNRLTKNKFLFSDTMLPSISGKDTSNYKVGMMQPGIEFNGFGDRWRYATGIVRGVSDGENNSDKDYFLQLAYKIGGLGFDGSGKSDKGAAASSKDFIRDDSIIISAFGYQGLETLEDSKGEGENRLWRAGLGASWKKEDLRIGGGVIWGSDSEPYGTVTDETVDSLNYYVDAEYFVYPWLVPLLRYESISFDLPEGVTGLQKDQDRARVIAAVRILARANVAILLEGRFHTKDERYTEKTPDQDKNQDDLIAIRLDIAF